MSIELHGGAPVLVVADIKRAVEYYRDTLGFKVEFLYGEPPFYAGVERGNVLIHLTAKETKRQPGHGAVYIFASDVDRLHEELKARGAKILKAPQDYDYGMRDFDVLDLDGNQLSFGQESKAAKA